MDLKTIHEYKGGIKTEWARSNRFVLMPSLATPPFPEMCISASVHGINIDTLDYRNGYDTAGWKQPYGTSYPDLTLTFNDQQVMHNRLFYEMWMNTVVNNTGVGYHDTYSRDRFQIAQVGRDGFIKTVFSFYEVYPISLSAIQYDYATQNSLTSFSVTLDHHATTRREDYDDARINLSELINIQSNLQQGIINSATNSINTIVSGVTNNISSTISRTISNFF